MVENNEKGDEQWSEYLQEQPNAKINEDKINAARQLNTAWSECIKPGNNWHLFKMQWRDWMNLSQIAVKYSYKTFAVNNSSC